MPVLFVYYVYDNPTYEVANKLICILSLYCIVLHCIALHCVALRCVALRCVALRCVALRCVALRCVALRCVALRCVALRCVALRCVALRCVALRCVALRCVALRCVALRCVALRCVALRCVAVHCSALHCIALQCNALHCIVYLRGELDAKVLTRIDRPRRQLADRVGRLKIALYHLHLGVASTQVHHRRVPLSVQALDDISKLHAASYDPVQLCDNMRQTYVFYLHSYMV